MGEDPLHKGGIMTTDSRLSPSQQQYLVTSSQPMTRGLFFREKVKKKMMKPKNIRKPVSKKKILFKKRKSAGTDYILMSAKLINSEDKVVLRQKNWGLYSIVTTAKCCWMQFSTTLQQVRYSFSLFFLPKWASSLLSLAASRHTQQRSGWSVNSCHILIAENKPAGSRRVWSGTDPQGADW